MAVTPTTDKSRVLGLTGACAVAAAVLFPAAASADEGPETRVIGGHDATEDYSFMVSLQLDGRPFCGGSLIEADWVVTAAHCVANRDPADFTARVGSHEYNDGGTKTGVGETIVHPEYTGAAGNDIALVKLDQAVEQAPVAIAEESGGAGTATRILGWGQSCFDEDCETPVVLQELDTKVVADDQCRELAVGKEICTDSDTPDAQACNGDSGGPQLKGRQGAWELIGATSRDGDDDPQCATGTGIWTDVTAHQSWIAEQIGA